MRLATKSDKTLNSKIRLNHHKALAVLLYMFLFTP